jgi:KDO2-lipid IV(A) lauroyltransferase
MRNFLESLALEGMVSHLGGPPLEVAYTRTRRLARIGRRVLRREWRWALRNLELVFGPDLPPEARHRLARLAFEQHFYSYMEGLRLADLDVAVYGTEHLLEAMARDVGAVGVGVHLGCWEAGALAVVAQGVATSTVYRPTKSRRCDELSLTARAFTGAEFIPKADVWAIRRALGRKRLILLAADMNMTSGGVPVPFLGTPAMSPSGPARLALRSGAPVVPVLTSRAGPGRVCVRFGAALDPAESVGAEDPVGHLTARVHEIFEPAILEHAEQYNWLHPRWRTRPEGPAWTLADPIESLWEERVTPFARLPERVMSRLSSVS